MREGVLAWLGHLGKLSHQMSSVSTSRNIYFQVTERCTGPIASSLVAHVYPKVYSLEFCGTKIYL